MSVISVAKRASAVSAPARTATVGAVQSALRIGEPDDQHEQEADRVAGEVMAGGPVKRHWSLAGVVAPPIVHDVLHSPGQPLDRGTRSYFEPRFGQDLGSVRIHVGANDAESARAVNARAYTVGEHIVLNTGQYAPQSSAGRRLLAHELTHVLQQRDAATFGPPGLPQEVEADRAAEAFSRDARSFSVLRHSGIGIARQPQGSGGTPGPTITPAIKNALIQKLFDERKAAPPAGIRQNAVRTFAVAAIVSPDGKVTYESAYYDTGAEHAEPQLLRRVAAKVQPGDTVAIAIDQVPCGANKANCAGALGEFRADPQHGSMRVYTVRALRRDVPPGTTPGTATPDQLVGPKTAITREPHERFLVESVEFRRVRLPIYSGPDVPEPTASPGAAGDVAGGQAARPSTAPAGAGAGEENIEGAPPRRLASPGEPVTVEPGFARTLGFAALTFAAGVGTSLLQGWMREKIAEDLAKLPQPKRDKRGIWEFLNDARTASAVHLIDVLSKDVKPYTTEFQPQHTKIMAAGMVELAAIALLPDKTREQIEKRFTHLDALKEEMSAYEDQLRTIDDNLAAILAMEPQAKETKKACDDMIAILPKMFAVQGGASAGFGFVPVPDPEDYSKMDSNLRYISVSIGMVFGDAHSAKSIVEKALQEATTFRAAVAKAWWDEFAVQLQMLTNERAAATAPKSQPAPPRQRIIPAAPQGPQLLPAAPPVQPKWEPFPGAPGGSPFAEAAARKDTLAKEALTLVERGNRIVSSSPDTAKAAAFLADERAWRSKVESWLKQYQDKGPDAGVRAMDELLNSDTYGGRLKQIRQIVGG